MWTTAAADGENPERGITEGWKWPPQAEDSQRATLQDIKSGAGCRSVLRCGRMFTGSRLREYWAESAPQA